MLIFVCNIYHLQFIGFIRLFFNLSQSAKGRSLFSFCVKDLFREKTWYKLWDFFSCHWWIFCYDFIWEIQTCDYDNYLHFMVLCPAGDNCQRTTSKYSHITNLSLVLSRRASFIILNRYLVWWKLLWSSVKTRPIRWNCWDLFTIYRFLQKCGVFVRPAEISIWQTQLSWNSLIL